MDFAYWPLLKMAGMNSTTASFLFIEKQTEKKKSGHGL
jgi:hypothetical protein